MLKTTSTIKEDMVPSMASQVAVGVKEFLLMQETQEMPVLTPGSEERSGEETL